MVAVWDVRMEATEFSRHPTLLGRGVASGGLIAVQLAENQRARSARLSAGAASDRILETPKGALWTPETVLGVTEGVWGATERALWAAKNVLGTSLPCSRGLVSKFVTPNPLESPTRWSPSSPPRYPPSQLPATSPPISARIDAASRNTPCWIRDLSPCSLRVACRISLREVLGAKTVGQRISDERCCQEL